MTILKTDKQVDLGLFIVVSSLRLRFYGWKFLETFNSFVKKEINNLFIVIPSKTGNIQVFFSFSFVYISLVGSATIVRLNGVSQPISIKYKMVPGLNRAVFRTNNFKMSLILDFSSFRLCFRTGLRCWVKKLDYLCSCKSKTRNVCNAVEGHYLQAMKIVHHHANDFFDWLITPDRESFKFDILKNLHLVDLNHPRNLMTHDKMAVAANIVA